MYKLAVGQGFPPTPAKLDSAGKRTLSELINWRWDRDLNPGDPFGPICSPSRRTRPLCDPTIIILFNLSKDQVIA